MRTALVAIIVGLFTAASVVQANEEATAPAKSVKVAKKNKKHKKEEKKAEGTTEAPAPAAEPVAPAPEGEKK